MATGPGSERSEAQRVDPAGTATPVRQRPELTVVLPTLNEVEALPKLRPRLEASIAPYRSEVIVVDDESTDGTIPLVREWEREGGVRLIVRPGRRGLATAVLEGLARSSGRAIVVMDADGSHDPAAIPSLVDPILEGRAEFVLGSRHVPGGASPKVTWERRAMSRAAAALARPLTSVRDPMSGFFSIAPGVANRAPLAPVGYKIGLEILVRCAPTPTLEVPIVFGPRIAGTSKLDRFQIGGYLRHVARLYAGRLGDPVGLPGAAPGGSPGSADPTVP